MVFSTEDKILIKNLQQLKGYTATHFLTKFRTKKAKTGQEHEFSDNSETVLQTYNSAK